MKTGRERRDWRRALTAEEAQQISPLEARIRWLRDELLIASARYHRIQNRASVRAGKSIPAQRVKAKRKGKS